MQPWLYIVLLGACIIIFAYLRPKDTESKRTAAVNDIEIALDQFAEELEEGNNELMVSVQGLKRELEAEINKLNGRLSVLERQSRVPNNPELREQLVDVEDPHQVLERVMEKPKNRRAMKKLEYNVNDIPELMDHKHEILEEKPDKDNNDIKNRYGTVFELHAEGKSIEYIAKKIGMNKGEIQLIIQLARQEEQFRA